MSVSMADTPGPRQWPFHKTPRACEGSRGVPHRPARRSLAKALAISITRNLRQPIRFGRASRFALERVANEASPIGQGPSARCLS